MARTDDPRATPADFAEAPFAYNEPLSQSGWAAPQNHAAAHGFTFTNTIQTGGHVLSARAVAEGKADIAALDALTWALIQRHDPFATTLREIARTEPTPVSCPTSPPSPATPNRSSTPSPPPSPTSPPTTATPSPSAASSAFPPDAYLAIPNPPPPA